MSVKTNCTLYKSVLLMCLIISVSIPKIMGTENDEERYQGLKFPDEFASDNQINDFLENGNSKLIGDADDENAAEEAFAFDQHYPSKLHLSPHYLQTFADADLLSAADVAESTHMDKRSKNMLLTKKESQLPIDQRSRDLRRQQAARWDIGFGKRASLMKQPKPFMDALYGKRTSLKSLSPKASFGRKQQWDIQYGRK